MDGDVYYTVVANSFVHLVMYFYYALQVLGIKVSWDMLVTLLQMFQFVTMNAQAIYILYYQCPYPNRVTSFYLVYIISLFFLFGNFLIRKHFFGPKKDKAAKKA
jgi:elongation of very long chain fatty acids protein 4